MMMQFLKNIRDKLNLSNIKTQTDFQEFLLYLFIALLIPVLVFVI